MRRIYLGIVGLIVSLQTVSAQEATPLSLQQCMDYAIKNNYTAKNARLDVLIQNAQNNQTISAALPHINGKVELDDYLNPQQSYIDGKYFGAPGQIEKIAFTLPYGPSASVSASQTLFDGGVLVALQARKTVLELARQNADVTNETIRYNVLKAYNSLVIAERQYGIVKNSLGYARSVEHDIKLTQESGFAEKIEVERTSVQVNNLATDSIKISNVLTVSEQMLKFQMGMDINTPIVLTDTNLVERKQAAIALLDGEKDYSRVPEFNLLQTQLKLNQYNVKRYQYAAIPTLNVIANAGYNYSTDRFNDVFTWPRYLFYSLVGVQLNVPIFNGLMRVNQVREAKLNVEKSKNSIENVKLNIDFMAAQSRTSLRNAILQAESQDRNVTLANDVLDLAQKKYKAGVGSNQEVTQAQTDQLTAMNNYFSAELDVINAEADLQKALGLLK